jgi:hypothetical protein
MQVSLLVEGGQLRKVAGFRPGINGSLAELRFLTGLPDDKNPDFGRAWNLNFFNHLVYFVDIWHGFPVSVCCAQNYLATPD